MRRVLLPSLSGVLLLAACGGSHAAENARAKARIFAPASEIRSPPQAPLDIKTLERSPETQDAILGMSENELRERVGSFRLNSKLHLGFSGPGRAESIDEERLVEQSRNGDLHLRIADSDGNGMEILSTGGKVYGRSRYGPFVLRDRQSGLADQREEVAGALASLYSLADRGLSLRELGVDKGCTRFGVALGTPRPDREPARFNGRLDADTAKRFQFIYGRHLSEAGGEICVSPQGVVTRSHLTLRWVAGGDAGSGEVRVELEEALTDLGAEVRLERPEGSQPEPHRPRGPFDTLDRLGFVPHADAGEE